VNYRTLSAEELLRIWSSNRNAMAAVMAADEIMNRLDRGDCVMVDKDEYDDLIKLQEETEK
jgi:hypothetical protein